MTDPILDVRDLRVEFPTRRGVLTAVRDISLSIHAGEILGVVGESGAGKSMTGMAILGLLEPPGRIAAGDDLDTSTVADNMTTDPVSVPASIPLEEACDLMIARGVRHLLVADGQSLVGVLNMRDVVGVLSGAATFGAVPPARGD